MEKVDLDLNNYTLDDLLHLFHIPANFDEEDLKQAKKMVLMTHPDKSHLDAKYFRFYSQAYKQLFSIWEFKRKQQNQNKSFQIDDNRKENHKNEHSLEKEQKKALDRVLSKKPEQFNQWFNEQFERARLQTEEDENGYGSWLTSNEDLDSSNDVNSVADMAKEMERKKAQIRSLTLYQEVEDLFATGVSASQLGGNAPTSYSSDLFSSLPYEDLRKAHTETVIPVTMEDYHNRRHFSSVDEYKRDRSLQDRSTSMLSEQQSLEYLRSKERKEEKAATERAYQMAKQAEEAEKKNKDFWSRILRIEK
jgi:hypothetical protein